MAVWRGPNGLLIEPIVLDKRACLHVSQIVNGRRYHEAYCSLAELATYVDLADLVEVYDFPRVPASAPRRLP